MIKSVSGIIRIDGTRPERCCERSVLLPCYWVNNFSVCFITWRDLWWTSDLFVNEFPSIFECRRIRRKMPRCISKTFALTNWQFHFYSSLLRKSWRRRIDLCQFFIYHPMKLENLCCCSVQCEIVRRFCWRMWNCTDALLCIMKLYTVLLCKVKLYTVHCCTMWNCKQCCCADLKLYKSYCCAMWNCTRAMLCNVKLYSCAVVQCEIVRSAVVQCEIVHSAVVPISNCTRVLLSTCEIVHAVVLCNVKLYAVLLCNVKLYDSAVVQIMTLYTFAVVQCCIIVHVCCRSMWNSLVQ